LESYPLVTTSETESKFDDVDYGGVMVPFRLRTDHGVLSFFGTTTVFGTPLDITLAELEVRLAKKKVLVGKSSISRFLNHLKLPFKKKSAGRRAGSARRRRRA